MSVVPSPAPKPRDAGARDKVAAEPSGAVGRRVPASEAWAKLVATIPRDAKRITFIGVTGSGKTTAARQFLETQASCWDLIIVHDAKQAEHEFEGFAIHDVFRIADDLRDRNPDPPAIYCVRGSVEDAAAVALDFGRKGVETLLVVGELSAAVSDGGREITAPTVRTILLEGRANHTSLLATTQMATRTPGVVFDNSATVLFNPGKKSIGYLERVDVVGADELRVLPGLAVMDQGGRGEFIVVEPARDWDGIVYTVDAT